MYVCMCVYLLRCSSRMRKVMRLGSGRDRSRCIMQFSLAAGSERAVGRETDSEAVDTNQSLHSRLLWTPEELNSTLIQWDLPSIWHVDEQASA